MEDSPVGVLLDRTQVEILVAVSVNPERVSESPASTSGVINVEVRTMSLARCDMGYNLNETDYDKRNRDVASQGKSYQEENLRTSWRWSVGFRRKTGG